MDDATRVKFLDEVNKLAAAMGVRPGALMLFTPHDDHKAMVAVPGLFPGWARMTDMLPKGLQAVLGALLPMGGK